MYPFTQCIHVIEMFLPKFINAGEDDVALEHVEHLWVFLLHLQLIGLLYFAHEKFGISLGVAIVEAAIL